MDAEDLEYIDHFFIMLEKCVDHYNDAKNRDDDRRLFYNDLMERLTPDKDGLYTADYLKYLRSLRIEDDYYYVVLPAITMKQIRDSMRAEKEAEETRLRPIKMEPSKKYYPFTTYDFGQVRSLTEFDVNFKTMKTYRSDQTVLLFIAMHGELIARDRILTPLKNSMMILNKFSMASPGQCSVSSFSIRQYVLYAMCDAEKTGKPLDILTMFKEARSHIYANTNKVDGITAFNRPEVSPLKADHDFSLKKQLENQTGFSREAIYDEVLGGDTYRGN